MYKLKKLLEQKPYVKIKSGAVDLLGGTTGPFSGEWEVVKSGPSETTAVHKTTGEKIRVANSKVDYGTKVNEGFYDNLQSPRTNYDTRSPAEFRKWFPEINPKLFTNFDVQKIIIIIKDKDGRNVIWEYK